MKQILGRIDLPAVDIAGIQAKADADIPSEVVTTNGPAAAHVKTL